MRSSPGTGMPMPIKIGRSNRWIATEIAAWLAERKRAAIKIEPSA